MSLYLKLNEISRFLPLFSPLLTLIRPTAFLDEHLVPSPKVSALERFDRDGRQKATLGVRPI